MQVVYMVTDKCNASCPHCYKAKHQSLGKSFEECESDIRHLIQQGHQVIVAGAEVLSDFEKVRLYKLANQGYLLSNGILLANDHGIFEKLSQCGISRIVVSWHIEFPRLISALPEHITKRAIAGIQKNNFDLQVNCVIGSENVGKLDKIIMRLLENGVRDVKFFQLMPINDSLDQYKLSEEQKKHFLEDIQDMRRRYEQSDIRIGLHANFNADLTEKSREARNAGLFCPAGKELVVVETDGRIYPCPFLSQDQFQIGQMQGGRMRIFKSIEHDGRDCLAEKLLLGILKK